MSDSKNIVSKTKKRKRNRRRRNNKSKTVNKDQVLIIRSKYLLFPRSYMVRLGFPDTTVIRTGGASPATNWSYNANNAYDPDPSFGTGAMPGFSELATIYERYRVHAFGIEGTVSTLDTVPVGLVVLPTPVFYGNNTRTVPQIQEYSANPLAISKTISGVNGGYSNTRVKKQWSMTQVVGNKSWLDDPNYTAFVSGSPATVYYLFVGAYNLNTGVNWTNGLGTNLRVYMDVEFYTRRNFTTLGSQKVMSFLKSLDESDIVPSNDHSSI